VNQIETWKNEHSIVIAASANRIWSLWADVRGWAHWFQDLSKAAIDGPFADGSNVRFKSLSSGRLQGQLKDVHHGTSFTTQMHWSDDVNVEVQRLIEPNGAGSLMTVCTQVTGPDAEQIGQRIAALHPQMLRNIKSAAEHLY
jgi:uncharacterized protein YndB with AHSA1/START domain